MFPSSRMDMEPLINHNIYVYIYMYIYIYVGSPSFLAEKTDPHPPGNKTVQKPIQNEHSLFFTLEMLTKRTTAPGVPKIKDVFSSCFSLEP